MGWASAIRKPVAQTKTAAAAKTVSRPQIETANIDWDRLVSLDFETFFEEAPNFNENAQLIKGVICGYRVEEIEDPLMQKIRYLDKLIDELAKGKAMEKILRT